MPGNECGIDADPLLYAAVATEIRTSDRLVIPAGTEVGVHLSADLSRAYDPRSGARASGPLILLDPTVESIVDSTRNILTLSSPQ